MSLLTQRLLPDSSRESKFYRSLKPLSLGVLKNIMDSLAAATDPKHLDQTQIRKLQHISLDFFKAVEKKQLTADLKRFNSWQILQDHLSTIQLIRDNLHNPMPERYPHEFPILPTEHVPNQE